MNIVEATKKALKEDKAIADVKEGFAPILFIPKGLGKRFLIIDGVFGLAMIRENQPALWDPKATDIISENWQVVDYDKVAVKNATKQEENMKVTIEGTPKEIKKVLQTISGGKEHENHFTIIKGDSDGLVYFYPA